jgi:hypothetical protein
MGFDSRKAAPQVTYRGYTDKEERQSLSSIVDREMAGG